MSEKKRTRAEMEAEIKIRGSFLMMACDVEYALLNILAYSTPDPKNQLRHFKEMRMAQKIECTIADLKEHKPIYYDEYKDYLSPLDSFRKWRNDFAHYKMIFPDKTNIENFELVFIDEEGGLEGLKVKHFTLKIFNEALDSFWKIQRKLAELWMKLKSDYDLSQGHPLVHPDAED
jgi:hypothetical protein